MFQNIGLPGLLIFVGVIWLIIWAILRASKRKSSEQKRIADALEKIAAKENDTK